MPRSWSLLDEHWTRKPNAWSDVRDIPAQLEDQLWNEIASLPVIVFAQHGWPLADNAELVEQVSLGNTKVVGRVGKQFYLVDSEGSNYARYALRLSCDPSKKKGMLSPVQIAAIDRKLGRKGVEKGFFIVDVAIRVTVEEPSKPGEFRDFELRSDGYVKEIE